MDICIRADGGCYIGMGHILRTIELAKRLKKRHNVFYACKVDKPLSDKYLAGINKVKEEGFLLIEINEKSFLSDLIKIKADCIITDSYDIDVEYFEVLKKHFSLSICFDDENICDYFNVDFLINQNIYANKLEYSVNKNTCMMLGCKYTILRDEFKNLPDREINKEVKKIMVTVGGSDKENFTEKIINFFKGLNIKLYVVVGPGFKNINILKKYENENIKLYFNANMSELMLECDLAISACGTTLYELATCGTPTIGIVVIENQYLAAESMDKLGIIKYSSLDKILYNFNKLNYEKRCEMSRRGKEIIDGMGIERIISNIEGGREV